MKSKKYRTKIHSEDNYCVISAATEDVEDIVHTAQRLINDGWVPLSGIAIDDNRIYQTLEKGFTNG